MYYVAKKTNKFPEIIAAFDNLNDAVRYMSLKNRENMYCEILNKMP